MPNIDIEDTLSGLTDAEREEVLKILKEYADQGTSDSLRDIVNKDYDEIPVDIETFLHDPEYLGTALTDAEGRFTLFPYWEDLLKKMFPDPLKPIQNCNTLILTGAIGIGKSTEAVVAMIYELYRMLCLRDPYVYYSLQPTDLITFAVINITLDAAKGVMWSKLQNMIQMSPWFMNHGTVSKADEPEWKPPKGIELIYGSQSRHIIGRAVFFCLDGDTVIKVQDGEFAIKDLVDKPIRVYNVSNSGEAILSDLCTVKLNGYFNDEYDIELEDGSIIKCTPNHRFMLKDGTYKEAQYLTLNDELADII